MNLEKAGFMTWGWSLLGIPTGVAKLFKFVNSLFTVVAAAATLEHRQLEQQAKSMLSGMLALSSVVTENNTNSLRRPSTQVSRSKLSCL